MYDYQNTFDNIEIHFRSYCQALFDTFEYIICVAGEGDTPTANMSSKRAKGKNTKKRPQRATSNVFAMFDQSQIQEFKEAFNMIDQNRDGFIDKEDLHDMLASLGKPDSLFSHIQAYYMSCFQDCSFGL